MDPHMKVKNKMQTTNFIERIKEMITLLFIMLVGYLWILIGSIVENPLM
jgi:hypothetical protein